MPCVMVLVELRGAGGLSDWESVTVFFCCTHTIPPAVSYVCWSLFVPLYVCSAHGLTSFPRCLQCCQVNCNIVALFKSHTAISLRKSSDHRGSSSARPPSLIAPLFKRTMFVFVLLYHITCCLLHAPVHQGGGIGPEGGVSDFFPMIIYNIHLPAYSRTLIM